MTGVADCSAAGANGEPSALALVVVVAVGPVAAVVVDVGLFVVVVVVVGLVVLVVVCVLPAGVPAVVADGAAVGVVSRPTVPGA